MSRIHSHGFIEWLEVRRLLAATDLDPSFGTGGKTLLDQIVSSYDNVTVMALTPDNKIILAGSSQAYPDEKGTLARYNLDGTIDMSFGQGGKERVTVPTAFADVVVNSDNSITTLSSTSGSAGIPLMQRYTATGAVDSTFSTSISPSGTPSDLEPTGTKFYLAVGNNIARVNANGSADTTFGTGGVLAIATEPNNVQFKPQRIAALSDGSFIVGGTYGSTPSGIKRAAFRHYSATGVLDTTFGTSGTLQLTTLSTNALISKLTLLSNGELQAIDNDNVQQGYIVRFTAAGVLDSNWGTGGLATVDPSSTYKEAIFDAAIDSNSRVLGLGYFRGTTAQNATEFLFRMNANGIVDTTFGTNGYVQGFQNPNTYVSGFQLALANNGYLYLDTSLDDQTTSIPPKEYLFRFNASSGTQDTSFGTGGSVMTSYTASAAQVVNGAALLNDGSVVFTGGQSGVIQGPLLVGKLNSSGQPAAFGPNLDGTTEVSFGTSGGMGYDVIGQSDGKIVVGGSVTTISGTTMLVDYGLARLNSDGTLDPNFGTGGTVVSKFDGFTTDSIRNLAIDSSGNIYAAGHALSSSVNTGSILRYTSSGQLDTNFGTSGRRLTSISPFNDQITAIIALANGQLLVAGQTAPTGLGYTEGFIIRLNHDGSTDNTFGSNGMVAVNVNSSFTSVDRMAMDSVGRIYTASYISSQQIQLRRYTAAGQLDSSFGTSGIANYLTLSSIGGITDLQLSGSGKLLVYGKTSGSPTDVYVMAFYTDGSPVSTFGTSGKQTYDFSGSDSATRILVRPNGKWVLTGAGTGTTTQADYAAVQVAGEPLDTTPPTMSAAQLSSPRPAVQVTFSEKVTPPTAANLTLISKTTSQTFAVPQSWVSYNSTTLQLTISPDATLPDDNYQLQIAGGSAIDFAGNTQPTSFTGNFFFLSADANGDRTVNALDFNALATNYGKAGTFSQGDFDFSGTVNSSDFAILAARYGKVLTAPSNAPLPMSARVAATNLFANQPIDDPTPLTDVLM